MRQWYCGIDPGDSGAIALVERDGPEARTCRFNQTTYVEQLEFLRQHEVVFGYLEQVSSHPKQGVRSVFTFGRSYGRCEMLLAAAAVPYDRITPAKWQQKMKCRSQGDKRITRHRACELFPAVKMTHFVADALLLAELAKRTHLAY